MTQTIEKILFAPGRGAFFYDDQAAIARGARRDGAAYVGEPVTSGFRAVRMPAQSLGIGVVLSDGTTSWGDMMSVQYSGAAGREPLFDSRMAEEWSREHIVPRLIGSAPSHFRDLSATALRPTSSSKPVPLAIQYGTSQALLRAAAHVAGTTMAEVICRDFQCPLAAARI